MRPACQGVRESHGCPGRAVWIFRTSLVIVRRRVSGTNRKDAWPARGVLRHLGRPGLSVLVRPDGCARPCRLALIAQGRRARLPIRRWFQGEPGDGRLGRRGE